MTRNRMALLLGGFILVVAGFSVGAETVSIQNEFLQAQVQTQPWALKIANRQGKVLLETAGGLSFTTVRGQKSPEPPGKAEGWGEVSEVTELKAQAHRLEISLAEKAGGPAIVKLNLFFLADKTLRLEAEILEHPEGNRLVVRFKSAPEDRYYGMGERFNSAEQRGHLVPNWTREGCFFNCEDTEKTYFPVPFFLNPAGYGLLLDDTHYSEFDFAKTDPQIFSLTNWNNRMDLMIFYGPEPLEVIENYTGYTGRITVPPPWAFGVWNSAHGGPRRMRQVAEETRREKIPTSCIWAWDWAGGYIDNYVPWRMARYDFGVDRKLYPDYEQMAEELHQNGFKLQAYFMPFLGEKSEGARQGQELGFLATDEKGGPAVFNWVFSKVVEPDLTNPAAREWWGEKFFAKAEQAGADGWMHDFSEWSPAWVKFSAGDGWQYHNEYPVLWAKAAREFWDRTRPDGDYAFYMRAGYTGSWKYANIMWTGDNTMNWIPGDGIPSVIPAVNSVGISGFPIPSTDISGYVCLAVSKPADKELFFRWTQLGALLPVMRTHENASCVGNWVFDRDRETLMLWKKYAELHVSLFPYFYTLAYEAAATGHPVVRHLMLHYPEDPGSRAEDYEFMLGDRILVAPVIVEHAREREVYFPPGEWVSWWDGKQYQGCADKSVRTTSACGPTRVSAPREEIPIFVKNGYMVPIYDSRIDTLVKEDRSDLNGWEDANSSVTVLFFGEGADDYTLWDGTEIHCESKSKSCTLKNSPLPRKFSFEFR